MSTSGGTGGAHRLARFMESLKAKGLEISDLAVRIRFPTITPLFRWFPCHSFHFAHPFHAP